MAKKSGPEVADLNAYSAEVNTESNTGTARGLIMVNCSYIDLLLRDLIRHRLVKHKASDKLLGDDAEGALSRFSARIDIALAIGVIEICEHTALHILRDIRNACAHRVEFDIDDQKIKNKIDSMVITLGHDPKNLSSLTSKFKLRSICVIIIARLSRRDEDSQISKLGIYDISKFKHRDESKSPDRP